MTDLDACLPPAPLRIAAAAIACFAGWSTADTVTVGPGGDFATIQAAIDAAEAGDAIEIDPGVYAESLSMRLPITLRPIAGAASGSVVIDPGGLGICVLVSGVAAPGVRLQGLTLRDGAAGAIAGGISSSNSHVVVSDCTFENHSGGLGGAIGIDGGSLVVQRSTFRNNAAFDGGAIDIASGAAVEIRDSVFIDNTALSTGGAINAIASSQVEIIGCTFVRNEAALLGGAITMGTGAQADIARCTFDSNHSDEFGGAIAVG
ncbi:MAG: right-handed parallel beta-helix repeat-containing protein, partial [Planctomycetota bacterium]